MQREFCVWQLRSSTEAVGSLEGKRPPSKAHEKRCSFVEGTMPIVTEGVCLLHLTLRFTTWYFGDLQLYI